LRAVGILERTETASAPKPRAHRNRERTETAAVSKYRQMLRANSSVQPRRKTNQ